MPEAPDKIVEVPGMGNVSFPGGMADDAISNAINGHLARQNAAIDKMQPPAHGGFFRALGQDALGAVKGLPYAAFPPALGVRRAIDEYQSERATGKSVEGQEDAARKAAGYSLPYRAVAPVAEGLGVNVTGMERSAAQGDTAGVLGHTALPLAAAVSPLAEGAVKPLGRAAGALGEGIGRLGNAELPKARMPIIGGPITPARVVGAVAGGALGDKLLSSHPYEGMAGGATVGALAGDAAATGLQKGGRALREWGGHVPPEEYQPVVNPKGNKIPTLDTRSAKFSRAEAAKEARAAATPPKIGGPPLGPLRFPTRADPEGSRIVTSRQLGESLVVKPGENYEAVRPNAGAYMTMTNERLQDLHDAGDLGATRALVARGIQPKGHATVEQIRRGAPLPKGNQ